MDDTFAIAACMASLAICLSIVFRLRPRTTWFAYKQAETVNLQVGTVGKIEVDGVAMIEECLLEGFSVKPDDLEYEGTLIDGTEFKKISMPRWRITADWVTMGNSRMEAVEIHNES